MSAKEGRVPHCLPMDITNVATHRPQAHEPGQTTPVGSAKPRNIWPIRCPPALRGPCREATMSAGRPDCAAGGEGHR
jgi:hypothetical protein